jgi:hypothetical protein
MIENQTIRASFFYAAAVAVTMIAAPGPALAGSGAIVCTPSVTGDSSIPNSGQYQHDCKMAMAVCATFGIVGAYDANRSGQNGFGRCLRKAVADDEREYEAWVKGGRVPVKPDPRAAEEQKERQEAFQREEDERMAQLRAICTPGHAVRVKATVYLDKVHVTGPTTFSGFAIGGQIAQAVGLDSSGGECVITFQRGNSITTGALTLIEIAPADQSALAQQQPPATFARQCRRSGWMTICTNVRN